MTDQLNFDDEEAEIERQEKALAARKANIAAQRAEIERQFQLQRPVVIKQIGFSGTASLIKIEPYRDDVVEIAKHTPGRVYNYATQVNAIPISEWAKFKSAIEPLSNVSFDLNSDLELQINKILFAPNFEITLKERFFVVETNARAQTHGIMHIPGATYDHKYSGYLIPLPEGWRLWNFFTNLPETQTIVWDEKASEFIANQVKQRLLLDKIALAKDWDTNIPSLSAKLRPFQNVGVAFAEACGGSHINADEMGLGKTIQAIAFSLILGGKVIVVTPASLKINWTREIKKFTKEKVFILSGTTPTLYDMSMMLSKDCPHFIIINYDILSTSTKVDESYTDKEGIFHKKITTKYPWIEVLNLINADLIVYDEAHYLKNTDSNRSKASRLLVGQRIMCLTGTPVLNRPGELWPMLHLIDPKTFPSLERFLTQYSLDGKTTRNIGELREAMKGIMIRRLKKDVFDELPPLNRINEMYELTPRAKKIYDRVLEGVYEVASMWNPNEAGNEKSVTNILVQIQRLKQVCAIDKVPATADLATRIYDSSDPNERPKKVLIFSQFKPTAFAIKRLLGHEAIGFVSRNQSTGEFITAQATEQDALVQEFQNNPDVHFLIVTEKTAKEGHNITQAQAVIFNDLFWTPAAHQQAEGRAYMRTGDPHGIDSYYHIAEETIDDWIMSLLAAKLAMIEEVVDGVNLSRVVNDESVVTELIKMIKDGVWRKK